ncbi:type I restriction-modification system, S subunit [Mesomycoplasma dispar]|uniref:Type I restriction-modification system, S subunit n=1 Tax=Mesomycoplasma dispar TaxID=86660 RepID=A0AAJ5TCC4_9BACT|nr:hypothetical protein MDIS_02985 [Mesomycoplasma dispar]VEU62149.1 type I restriction-modification system, S subunit [Mesomycoplasma dispar]
MQTVTPKFVNFDATIPSLSMEKMKKIEVLIPAKIIQNKISLIFSLFEKTINNVEEEVKLLEKQYHFYRNLIFDKLTVK